MNYGAHLIVVKPGHTIRLFNIDPAIAPAIAASTYCIDEISNAILKACELHTANPLTEKQQAAYNNFLATLESADRFYLTYGSARDAAQAGVDALVKQVTNLLDNPATKKAYENLMLLSKLTLEEQNKG